MKFLASVERPRHQPAVGALYLMAALTLGCEGNVAPSSGGEDENGDSEGETESEDDDSGTPSTDEAADASDSTETSETSAGDDESDESDESGGGDGENDETEGDNTEGDTGDDEDPLQGLEWLTNCDDPTRLPKTAQEFRELRDLEFSDLTDIVDPLFAKISGYLDQSQHSECPVGEGETCIGGDYELDNGVLVHFMERTNVRSSPEGEVTRISLLDTELTGSEQTPDWQSVLALFQKSLFTDDDDNTSLNAQWRLEWTGEFFDDEWTSYQDLQIDFSDAASDDLVNKNVAYQRGDKDDCYNVYSELSRPLDEPDMFLYEINRGDQKFSVFRAEGADTPTLAFINEECVAEVDFETWADIGACP